MKEELVQMRSARLKKSTLKMSLADALAWARDRIPDGWLLSESPEKLVWLALAEAGKPESLGHCENLYIFGAAAELRLCLDYGAETGIARLVESDESGEAGTERVSSYLLVMPIAGNSRLEYAEFFRPDPDTGLPRFEFGRYCGLGR